MKATARAHTNIALIKYWGKKDAKLKLPQNSSLSMTLDAFYTDTTFTVLADGDKNQFILNDVLQTPEKSSRVFDYIQVLQNRFNVSGGFKIESNNHVPTSAGLASSASAFAALAKAFVFAYEINIDDTELSRLARLGSGSATRSIYGGFVEWQKGIDDETSIAIPIDENPTMDLNLLAVEINSNEKSISSTKGMDLVTKTSPYYPTWITQTEQDLQAMKQAIEDNDFSKLGHLAQQNALAMHALNLTANPAFTYFQPDTIKGMQIVSELNRQGIECYFTMDAGPNLKILVQSANVKKVITRFNEELSNVKIIKATFGPGVQILQ